MSEMIDGVDFVDEDDARRFLFCQSKGIADHLCTITYTQSHTSLPHSGHSSSQPINICTNCGPASLRNVAFVCAAHARAICRHIITHFICLFSESRCTSVLPVPGGPNRRTPLGGLIPKAANRSACVNGNSIASLSSWPHNRHPNR